MPQRDERVDARRARARHQAGNDPGTDENRGNRDEGCRVGAGHTPEEVLEEPCQRDRRGDTKADADKQDDEGPPDDESQQAAGAGAEGAADAELAVAVRDRMRGDPVDADDADAQRDRAKIVNSVAMKRCP